MKFVIYVLCKFVRQICFPFVAFILFYLFVKTVRYNMVMIIDMNII